MVSVVVPIYNAERSLARCLRSIQVQSYTDFEVLMINDGSTDESGSIARSFEKDDSRFRLFSQENRGVSAARNLALEKASGDYVLFADSDDALAPDHLRELMAAMAGGCELAVCGYYECWQQDGRQLYKSTPAGCLSLKQYASRMARHPIENYFGVLWNKLFSRRLILQCGLRFDTASSYGEDTAFLLAYMHEVKTVCVTEYPGYYYSFDGETTLSNSLADDVCRIRRTAYVYRHYRQFWLDMGWYRSKRMLVQFYGARLYFEERKKIARDSWEELYQQVLADNGFSGVDYTLFWLIRYMRYYLRRLLGAEKGEKTE